MTHYSADVLKRALANEKRRTTNLHLHGCFGSKSKSDAIRITKQYYKKVFSELDKIEDLYSKQQVIDILNGSEFNYSKYLGKAKNRTMINDNPKLYMSLMKHTNCLSPFNRFRRISFSFRLIYAGKYKCNLSERQYCRCKKHIMYNPVLKDIRLNSFCRHPGCVLGPNSKERFQYIHGNDWEQHYIRERIIPKQSLERHRRHQFAGRMSYQKRASRSSTKFHAIGKNENIILDKQEVLDNCKIDRNFTVIGFYPDGYCHETNTVYEVYEEYHKTKYMKQKDADRQQQITETLNCKFVVIWDENKHKI